MIRNVYSFSFLSSCCRFRASSRQGGTGMVPARQAAAWQHATAGSLYDISTLGKPKDLQFTIYDLQFGNIAAPVGAVPLSARRIICERTVSPLQCGKNARRDATLGVSPHPHSGALRGWHAWVVPHGFHPWLSSLREHPAIRRGYIQRAYGAVDYKYHLAFCQMIHHLHCAARRLFLVPSGKRPTAPKGRAACGAVRAIGQPQMWLPAGRTAVGRR